MERRQGRPTTVLVVEDEAVIGNLIRRNLARAGYQVLLVADGDQALALIHDPEQPLDALLTDLWLPGVDGAQLAHATAAARPGTAILVSSGLPNPAALPPRTRFLAKPFQPRELLAALAAAIAEKAEPPRPTDSSVE